MIPAPPKKPDFRHPAFFNRFVIPSLVLKTAYRIGMGRKAFLKAGEKFQKEQLKEDPFGDYQPIKGDIFATVYSKSGTNLLLQALVQISYRGNADFKHIHDLVAWPEGPFKGIIPLEHPYPRAANPMGIRVIKTHKPTTVVPYNETGTYIPMIRDPKEVFVSAYHFMPRVFGIEKLVGVDDWLEAFLSDGFMVGPWADHLHGWWALRDRPNVHPFFFRESISQQEKFIDELAGILNVELTPEEKARVVEKCSFAYMKENESKFGPPMFWFARNKAKMMRKGKVGSSGELLTPEMKERIDTHFRNRLKTLGSDFPYEERFM